MKNYRETLMRSGLSAPQAEVYETLLAHGKQVAGEIAKRVDIKRGLVYKSLDDLVGMGLAEKETGDQEVFRFSPKHPSFLADIVEKKEREVKSAQLSLEGVLPVLISRFNLSSGGPGIRVYEGEEAIRKILDDSLTARKTIRSYVDVEAVEKNIKEINRKYMRQRERLHVAKKLLVADNAFTRDLYKKETGKTVTEVRFIPARSIPFEVTMQIYDGKVSYLTLLPGISVGVLIEDEHIFQMHAFLFDVLYERANNPS